MSKLFQFDHEALKSCLSGVKIIAKAVMVTLGPKGRNVVILQPSNYPLSTKDGVSVAKEIILKDKFENMAAQLVKEASSKTNDVAGDGTTTAIVLSEAIFSLGVKNVMAGCNPMSVKHGIDKAVSCVIEELDRQSKPISSEEEVFQIATISANNDPEIGKIISDAMKKVGKEGTITVTEAQGIETTLDVVEGMQFDRGYCSPYFVTDAEKMLVEMDHPLVLVSDKKISNVKQLIPVLEAIHAQKKPLLIIAEDIESEALTTLVVNKIKAGLSVCAVKAPGFGDRRKAILQDIASLCGAALISEEAGLDLEKVQLSQLGRFKKAKISKDHTTLIDGLGHKDDLHARCDMIRHQISVAESDYDKKALEDRLAKLTGGVAVIHLGAATETELKEKKARVEDALHATKAAIAEGIVAGGGVALIRASQSLNGLLLADDERAGLEIIKHACYAPASAIATNCGKIGAVVTEKIAQHEGSYGYNGLKDTFGDLIKEGIVDPVRVTKTALKNAASVSGMLLTIACMITDKPKPPTKTPQMPQMDGFDGMDMM